MRAHLCHSQQSIWRCDGVVGVTTEHQATMCTSTAIGYEDSSTYGRWEWRLEHIQPFGVTNGAPMAIWRDKSSTYGTNCHREGGLDHVWLSGRNNLSPLEPEESACTAGVRTQAWSTFAIWVWIRRAVLVRYMYSQGGERTQAQNTSKLEHTRPRMREESSVQPRMREESSLWPRRRKDLSTFGQGGKIRTWAWGLGTYNTVHVRTWAVHLICTNWKGCVGWVGLSQGVGVGWTFVCCDKKIMTTFALQKRLGEGGVSKRSYLTNPCLSVIHEYAWWLAVVVDGCRWMCASTTTTPVLGKNK